MGSDHGALGTWERDPRFPASRPPEELRKRCWSVTEQVWGLHANHLWTDGGDRLPSLFHSQLCTVRLYIRTRSPYWVARVTPIATPVATDRWATPPPPPEC